MYPHLRSCDQNLKTTKIYEIPQKLIHKFSGVCTLFIKNVQICDMSNEMDYVDVVTRFLLSIHWDRCWYTYQRERAFQSLLEIDGSLRQPFIIGLEHLMKFVSDHHHFRRSLLSDRQWKGCRERFLFWAPTSAYVSLLSYGNVVLI